ncbi:3-deoxy-D-manno-octulosonic acid kinase [Orrella marina]|uniref:3-deoxy-D-manno-octulosonic acid kinase n=1 Tax=Orrella marina TaxID=2163011 RepID=A0A2R4XFU7_9BURK|nr:3-deoxy-D-manno-octulosonic acid kinase [Orrella marina]AWB32619.1 3-deoxy-D-manno-octulosonic acid kinase [Orrella marina]
MIAKLSRDLYWWTGRDQTRSFREFDILAALAERSGQGLNVPRPVAAMACRTHGLFYRAALITQRIAQAEAFWKYDDGLIWERAGQMIARLHRAGVWHADLNVNNILIDPHEKIWLIDFDRARTGVTDPKRLYGNLQRLERSVRKVCSERIHDCWPMLLSGYARAPD